MIWDFGIILRPLRRSRPPTRGQTLRRAMRTAPSRPASPEDERVDLADVYGPGAELANMLRRKRLVLRDGTPYEQSGAHENDWRL